MYNNHTYGPFYYSYFNAGLSAIGLVSVGNGGMYSDFMTTPRLITGSQLSVWLGAPIVAEVFAAGIPTTVSCTEDGGIVTCDDFILDSTQSPI